MKYCTKCANELLDEAVICPKCGCPTEAWNKSKSSDADALKTVSKIFMIIGCVVMGFWLIPLAWCIPMTVSYCNKLSRHEPVSLAFKVCTLLFVSQVAGICMLCDSDN